ncbi:MAG: phosphatase PAP2 family protein [Bryobacteraceae bacterium]|jgi:membrane-associated phospholipid phosphatase
MIRGAFAFLVLVAVWLPEQLRAQDAPAGEAAGQTAPAAPVTAPDRDVSWKQLPTNILSDQKNIWLFPAHLRHRRALLPALAVVGTTVALVMAADPTEGRAFRDSRKFLSFNRVVSGNNASIGMAIIPASMYVVGLIRKDDKPKKTALLAGEAVVDAEIVTSVMKDIDRRLRPAVIGLNGNYSDTWFKSGGNFLRGEGSFPSGHTIAAAAIATVVARRYGRQHRWVPYVAYGLTGLVGFSRMTWSAHFVSDVFVGGALGYSISRFVVLRQ